MIRLGSTFLAGLVAILSPATVAACAGCSNPNLPTAPASNVTLRAGQFLATLNLTGTTMRVVHSEHCPDIGPICEVRDEPDQIHDQTFYVGELRPVVEVGFTDTWGAEAQLPFRFTRTTVIFRRMDGTPFTPDYQNIHHRNENLVGVADPWLSGRGGWRLGDWSLTVRAGLTLPLGRTEPDPFALAQAGEHHQHIQFGTGTINPLVGVDVARRFGTLDLSATAQSLLFLYQNGYGYQAGNRFRAGVAAQTTFFSKLRVGVGVDVLNEQPERWGGVVQQDGNVGRTDLLVGGNIGYEWGPSVLLLSVRSPVWQQFIKASHTHDDDPGQLTYPAIVNVAFQRTVGDGVGR